MDYNMINSDECYEAMENELLVNLDLLQERRFNHAVNSVLNSLVDKTVATVENQQGNGSQRVLFGWNLKESNQLPRNNRFKRTTTRTTFQIKHNFGSFSELSDIKLNIDGMYEKFMTAQLAKWGEEDLVSVGIRHENPEIYPLFIPPTTKKTFKREALFNVIEKVAQSNTILLLDGKLFFEVNVTECAVGSGRTKGPQTSDERRQSSHSVVVIKNKDNGCAFYALAVAIGKANNLPDFEWRRLVRNQMQAQKDAAKALADLCGMSLDVPVNVNDFNLIQQKLDYKIVVVDGTNKRNRLFVGNKNCEKSVYILHSKTLENEFHYDAITNINGYMGCNHYCKHCHSTYTFQYQHKCQFICSKCFRSPPCFEIVKVSCVECNNTFMNEDCYSVHLANHAKSICKNVKYCNICSAKKEKNHVCNQRKCHKCGQTYSLEVHHCNLKTLDMKKIKEQDSKNKIIIAYDIESQQKKTDEKTYLHIADLLISMTTCDKCWEGTAGDRTDCDVCGKFKHIFEGKTCIKEFGNYVYNSIAKSAAKIKAEVYVFAHNAQGYDNHFVLNDMLTRYDLDKVSVIMNGNKIMKASTANVRFLDSLLMFQQPLAALPKAFGFEHIVQKGFFPHLFHTSENLDYIGPLPEPKYFGTEFMKPNTLRDFNKWYQSQPSTFIFNLKNELIKYCENDVLILLNCVQKFREIFKNVTEIDPITRNFTLASMGLEVFKAKVLGDIKVGVTPVIGYSDRRKQSRIGRCWLDYQKKVLNCEIQREVQVDGYFVDGFDKQSNTVFEYNGCYFHGCECTHKGERDIRKQFLNGNTSKFTPNQMLANTNNRRDKLKRRYRYIEESDCSLAKKRKEPEFKDMDQYIKDREQHYKYLKQYGGVVIRDSFFGGRTNNIKFYEDLTDQFQSRILYYDFRSLYPTVLKYDAFPVGHPKVINEFNQIDPNISSYFGFVKCAVSAPKHLRIPVLPVRTKDKKLIFPLCSKCCEQKFQSDCPHSDIERQLIGTWTTIELNEAIKQGYTINYLFEVYHYEESTKDLFSKYVNMWLKYKQESDGWPDWVDSDEAKEKYVNDFLIREGIALNADEIKKNPGLRYIAKLFLNTLWGKFAQRPNLTQTKICKEYKDYWSIAKDPEKVIKGETMINDDCLIIDWEYVDDEKCDNVNTALAIASFVTSYARTRLLKLMNEIEVIPGRLLYFDTDSVIFKWTVGEPKPECDDFLGCLADEISKDYGPEAICTKFVSNGSKVYSLEIWPTRHSTEPVVPVKVKGITLTDRALDIIKMETMVRLAQEYIEKNGRTEECEKLLIPQMVIRSDKMHTVETRLFSKQFRAMSDKRRINGNDTLPYGYIKTSSD